MYTGGASQCIACNSTLHFESDGNYGCKCNQGFYLNNFQLCVSRCGDGSKVDQEVCDDANLNNGDGCDSQCQV